MPTPRAKRWIPATSLASWGLALLLIVGLDVAIAHTSLLWGPTRFEHRGEAEMLFGRSFQVARTVYGPQRDADFRIAVLGNSRLVYALQERTLERVLTASGRPGARVDQLAMFGACPEMLETVSRRIDALAPDVIVLAINGSDLEIECESAGHRAAMRPFDLGVWNGEETKAGDWLDRFARTHWRLWRYRSYLRARIEDGFTREAVPRSGVLEDSSVLDSLSQIFAAGSVSGEQAYREWQGEPSLRKFVDYLKVAQPLQLKAARLRASSEPDPIVEARNLAWLDVMLRRMVSGGATPFVLLMPENPIFASDRAGRFHRVGDSERGARLIEEVATGLGVQVIDGRRWLPARFFLDLTHLRPGDSIFELMLARNLLDRLEG